MMPLEQSDSRISEADTGEPARVSVTGVWKRATKKGRDRWHLQHYYRNHGTVRQRDIATGAKEKTRNVSSLE